MINNSSKVSKLHIIRKKKIVLSDGLHYMYSNFGNVLRFQIIVGLLFSETPCSFERDWGANMENRNGGKMLTRAVDRAL